MSSASLDTVAAVLFDMDGVLCDSEDRSRAAAVALFKEMGIHVDGADFLPFMGTGARKRIRFAGIGIGTTSPPLFHVSTSSS